jgi:hypothetical protein
MDLVFLRLNAGFGVAQYSGFLQGKRHLEMAFL